MLFFFRKVNEPVLLFDPNFNNVSSYIKFISNL